jgi:hypothetical protein
MIDRSCMRTGVYVSQWNEKLSVDFYSNFFLNLAKRRRSYVNVFRIQPAARKNESAWVIPEVRGTAAQINLYSMLSVPDEGDGSSRNGFILSIHEEGSSGYVY